MKYILAVWFLLAVPLQGAPLVLFSPAEVDSLSGDTLQPAIAHSLYIDTVTVDDTVGYSINYHLRAFRWPDSLTINMYGIGADMLWAELAAFTVDSVESLDSLGQSYMRRVWWSGSTMLEDSVIVPGVYRISGDSLLK